jgi:hypothetical protein
MENSSSDLRKVGRRALKSSSAMAHDVPSFYPMPTAADEILLTEKLLSKRWGLASEKKLQADRLKGAGCRFVRIGRAVRYRLSDVLAYEAANLRTSTSEC